MLLGTTLVLASAAAATLLPRQQSGSDACGQLSQYYFQNSDPGLPYVVTNSEVVQVAYDCLTSIPFNAELAAGFLAEFSKVLQFHSTIEILKSPPDTYKGQAVDLIRGLSAIEDSVNASKYSSYYEFEVELSDLVGSSNDEHLSINLCTLGLFQFRLGNYSLAAVSSDGNSVPDLFLVDFGGDIVGGADPSPVTKINDQDVTDYIGPIMRYQNPQDPDASYNFLLPSLSRAAINYGPNTSPLGDGGSFYNRAFAGHWPGANTTTVTFRNGETQDVPTWVVLNFASPFASAEALFTACLPTASGNQRRQEPEDPSATDVPSTQPEATESAVASFALPLAAPSGYPEPVIKDDYNQVIGYYLDDETAVLVFPTFESGTTDPKPDNTSLIVGQIAAQFVQDAVDTGRTKMIIDLSANLGGSITRAFDIFLLFFPDLFPYLGTRFRRHAGADLLSKALGSIDPSIAVNNGPFTWRVQVTPDQDRDFPSLNSFLGDDEKQYDVPVSAEMAVWNITAQSNPAGPIRGYGDIPAGNKTQPFAADDILLITDGACASTCAAFAYMMTNIGNARSIAFGGRPQTGPMQLIGGTRGAQTASYAQLQSWIQEGVLAAENNPGLLSDEEIQQARAVVPLTTPEQWPVKCLGGSVNIRNAYAEGDGELPLQFQYQAADARRFYTWENLREQRTVWRDAKETVWGGGKAVEGSTGAQGSRDHRNGKAESGSGSGSGSGNETGNAESGDRSSNAAAGGHSGSVALMSAAVALGVALVM